MTHYCNGCGKQVDVCVCDDRAMKDTHKRHERTTLVIVESPYAGDIEKNVRYLRACMRDCLLRGEAPFASHGLYTQEGVLRDDVPAEREHGIQAGFAWRSAAEKTVVYTDLGTSRGMDYGIAHARELGHPIEYRELGGEWQKCGAV